MLATFRQRAAKANGRLCRSCACWNASTLSPQKAAEAKQIAWPHSRTGPWPVGGQWVSHDRQPAPAEGRSYAMARSARWAGPIDVDVRDVGEVHGGPGGAGGNLPRRSDIVGAGDPIPAAAKIEARTPPGVVVLASWRSACASKRRRRWQAQAGVPAATGRCGRPTARTGLQEITT